MPGISENNIGYKLLRKAGWVEGKGLGAKEQGCKTPIRAWQQSGKEGIGTKQGSAGLQHQIQPGPSKKQKAAEKKKFEEKLREEKAARKRRREELALLANPKEDLETKKKRVKQVRRIVQLNHKRCFKISLFSCGGVLKGTVEKSPNTVIWPKSRVICVGIGGFKYNRISHKVRTSKNGKSGL